MGVMEGLRKSEKFMSEYKLSIFLTLAMLAMLFFTAGMKTDAAEVPNGLVVNNGVISYYENETVVTVGRLLGVISARNR